MKLTVTQVRYLLTGYVLNKNNVFRSADIADSLDVSRPSVHRMITQLCEMGLLEKEKYSSVRITRSGQILAERYYSCFSRICGFLKNYLNLPPSSAEEGALSIVGSLSMEKLESVCIQPESETIVNPV